MDWDLAYSLTKRLFVLLLHCMLLFGSVAMGVTVGGLVFLVGMDTHDMFAPLYGLIGGVTAFFAGAAGRKFAYDTYLSKIISPKS